MNKTWPNGVPKISKKRRKKNLQDTEKLHDLISTLWLYMGIYEEQQLTTEQKELMGDVVERKSDVEISRWWRK